MRAFQHSCGGWFAAEEDKNGFIRVAPGCVLRDRCYSSPAAALGAARAREEETREEETRDQDREREEKERRTFFLQLSEGELPGFHGCQIVGGQRFLHGRAWPDRVMIKGAGQSLFHRCHDGDVVAFVRARVRA